MFSWYSPLERVSDEARTIEQRNLPGDLLGAKQIGNSGHIRGNLVEIVVVHAKVLTTSRGAVVGLRGVCHSIVVGEQDTLRRNLGEVGVASDGLVILVLEPDVDETVESQTLDIGGRGKGTTVAAAASTSAVVGYSREAEGPLVEHDCYLAV